MKVVITGGGGFLGFQLAKAIQEKGKLTDSKGAIRTVEEICLFDQFFADKVLDQMTGNLTVVEGDVSNRESVFSAVDGDHLSIFHLASMVSGECEERFDDAISVNLMGGMHVFEAARAIKKRPKVVFASSIACFGGRVMPEVVGDQTKRTPQTTYGVTKTIGELLVNDYSRKGFFDGRSVRLPTVIIRPGQPNAAASSWASGMFREPLNGEDCLLPVHREQRHPMTGYGEVIDSFMAIHELDESVLGDDRALQLPAHSVTPHDADRVIKEIGGKRDIDIGEIVDQFNPDIQKIVDQWPTAVDGKRALDLGIPEVRPLTEIVEQYIDDFC